jgi:tetratricopeptide (TPR) repeat protein
VEAWNHKATLHLSRRQFDQGIDALENSLRWDPRQPNTVLQCGLALTVAERHETALRWFQRGRRMAPEAVRFAEGEAMALALHQAARQEIEFVVDEVRAMPQHDESVCLLVMTALEVREGDRSEAENIFAQAQHQMQGAPSSSVVRQILYDRVREMLGFTPSRSRPGG